MKKNCLWLVSAVLALVTIVGCFESVSLTGIVSVEVICPLPLQFVADPTATGTFNAACPYLRDSLGILVPVYPINFNAVERADILVEGF